MINLRIGFSKPKGPALWFSQLIMWFTGAKASHVWFLYWDDDFKCNMVMEAHNEIRILPFSAFVQKNTIIEVYEPKVPLDAGLPSVRAWLGSSYDYTGLVGMLVVEAGRLLKRRWKNPMRSAHHVFCSKLAVILMQAVKYPLTEGWDSDSTDPWNIRNLMANDGSKLCDVLAAVK